MRSPVKSVLASCLFASLATFSLSGCGESGPAVAPVSGVVKLNGEPVEGAAVTFEPVKEGRSSFALTDATGQYTLRYLPDQKGALLGEHVVKISKARKSIKDDAGKVIDPGIPELFPGTANSQSELKADVVKGSNTFDFDIKK